MSKFELYKGPYGGFRWQLKSTEGQTITVSAEAHKTMADLQQNIATVKREGASPISTTRRRRPSNRLGRVKIARFLNMQVSQHQRQFSPGDAQVR